jgi:hypothetical protein
MNDGELIRFVDPFTGKPFDFGQMVDDMVERVRQERLEAGLTTWPDGTPLAKDDE